MISIGKLIRALVPAEVQIPRSPLNEILYRSGYFKLRTSLAAHGLPVPDDELYRPLFSPWEGEPSFNRFYQPVKAHTACSRDRCYFLWTTLRQALVLGGDVVECGVYRGGTALLEAMTMREASQSATRKLHLFDSFEGMPQTAEGIDRFRPGDFSTTSEARVQSLLSDFPFVAIHAGFIPATFEGLEIEKICWAHIDVDLYQSVQDSINFIYPRLCVGGMMVFDDYGFPSCPGARKAVDEAFASRPEVPICLPTGQCLIIKSPATGVSA